MPPYNRRGIKNLRAGPALKPTEPRKRGALASEKETNGRDISRPRLALRCRVEGVDRQPHRRGGEGLLSAAAAPREDRHPEGGAREPAAQEARRRRVRDQRSRRAAAH